LHRGRIGDPLQHPICALPRELQVERLAEFGSLAHQFLHIPRLLQLSPAELDQSILIHLPLDSLVARVVVLGLWHDDFDGPRQSRHLDIEIDGQFAA
jgi:hypothetical protein